MERACVRDEKGSDKNEDSDVRKKEGSDRNLCGRGHFSSVGLRTTTDEIPIENNDDDNDNDNEGDADDIDDEPTN